MYNTVVISAFPGCGKSFICALAEKGEKQISCLDSDSSYFSWIYDSKGNNTGSRNPNFPKNYINYIKENIGKVEVIFVSSHENVRKALEENGIKYTLVFPDRDLKEVFIKRFKDRGNPESFIKFISESWDEFITDMEKETYPKKFRLHKDYSSYLDDILTDILVSNYREHLFLE